MNVPGYERLAEVLRAAYEQAAKGKGAERHADGKAFHEQPMQQLIALYGTGFAMGQAAKKAQEAMRMETAPAVRELLGAINYLAGAVIFLQQRDAADQGEKPSSVAGVAFTGPIVQINRIGELNAKQLEVVRSRVQEELLRIDADKLRGVFRG